MADTDILRSPAAGGRVIRGGTVRALGYGGGVVLAAATSVLLLRHLGVVDFGRYATVAALLGIVSGVTDAGLTAVGARELAVRAAEERPQLLRNLVALRLLVTPLGVAAAAFFAWAAGYGSTLVWGTLLGGLGVILVNTQATMMMPLSVELRLGALTAFEVARGALTLLGVALLVALGAGLLEFFGVQAVVGLAILLATPLVLRGAGLRPRVDRATATTLVREALPMAAALAMNVVYFRVLVVLVSLLGTATATGLFGTSFRVFEVLFGLPLLVVSAALPVLAVAGHEDEERLRYSLQRMTEVGLAVAIVLVLVIVILAEPALVALAGEDYRDAAPVLRIQAVALIPVFLGQTWQLGLVAVRRQAALAWANGIALAVVVAAGVALIEARGATGAAIAAVVAETVLAALLLWFLRRARPALVPRLGLVPRVVAAGAVAALALLVPGPEIVAALAAVIAFVAAAALVRALPPELLAALRSRA
jgi:O-antigen/teichoic acid export membrane protein